MGMTAVERKKYIDEFRAVHRDAVMESKGEEYASGSGGGEKNVNANFDLVAMLLAGAPMDSLTVSCVYFLKHVAAICNYVVTRKEGSEPIEGRFGDAANYTEIMASVNHSLKRRVETEEIIRHEYPF